MPGVIKVSILKNNFQHSNNVSVITGYTEILLLFFVEPPG